VKTLSLIYFALRRYFASINTGCFSLYK